MILRLNIRSLPGPFLIVAPHPDDDVLGNGGLIQRAHAIGKTVYVVYVTAGDANGESVTHYLHKPLVPKSFIQLGYVRHFEAIKAENFLGTPKSNLFFLGFPDSITYNIVTDPIRNRVHPSPFTKLMRASYTFAYQRYAPYTHGSILRLVKSILQRTKPGTIFVTLKQDTNPDHAASHIIIHQAVRQMNIHPVIYSYLIHYPHYPNPTGLLQPPAQLRIPNVVSLPLTVRQTNRTREAYTIMRSQSSLGYYYYRWIRRNELYWRTPSG